MASFRKDVMSFNQRSQANAFERHRTIDFKAMGAWMQVVSGLAGKSYEIHETVLDVACGSGRFSIPLAMTLQHLETEIVGVDRSQEMIRHLKRKVVQFRVTNLKAICADIFAFEPNQKVKGIFISDFLHLVLDIDQMVEQLHKLLQSSGWLCIRMSSHEQIKQIEWLQCFPRALEIDLMRTHAVSIVAATLLKYGFEDLQVKTIDESELVPTGEYIKRITVKAFSILHLLNEAETIAGTNEIIARYGKNSECRHTSKMTCITAIKRQ